MFCADSVCGCGYQWVITLRTIACRDGWSGGSSAQQLSQIFGIDDQGSSGLTRGSLGGAWLQPVEFLFSVGQHKTKLELSCGPRLRSGRHKNQECVQSTVFLLLCTGVAERLSATVPTMSAFLFGTADLPCRRGLVERRKEVSWYRGKHGRRCDAPHDIGTKPNVLHGLTGRFCSSVKRSVHRLPEISADREQSSCPCRYWSHPVRDELQRHDQHHRCRIRSKDRLHDSRHNSWWSAGRTVNGLPPRRQSGNRLQRGRPLFGPK